MLPFFLIKLNDFQLLFVIFFLNDLKRKYAFSLVRIDKRVN